MYFSNCEHFHIFCQDTVYALLLPAVQSSPFSSCGQSIFSQSLWKWFYVNQVYCNTWAAISLPTLTFSRLIFSLFVSGKLVYLAVIWWALWLCVVFSLPVCLSLSSSSQFAVMSQMKEKPLETLSSSYRRYLFHKSRTTVYPLFCVSLSIKYGERPVCEVWFTV